LGGAFYKAKGVMEMERKYAKVQGIDINRKVVPLPRPQLGADSGAY
jgi:hypothetical protein